MNRFALCFAVLASSAQAQLIEPCGGSASCVRVGIPDGGQVQLGGVLQSSRYAQVDGGGVQVRVVPLITAPIAILGNQPRSSTTPDVVLGGTTARDGGQVVLQVKTATTTIATLTGAGNLTLLGGVASSGAISGTSVTASGPSNLTGVTSIAALDAGVQSKVGGVSIGGLVAQDGGISTHVCQFGYGAMTANALAVTYTRAFSSLPQCFCTHVDTTNANPCTILAAGVPSTTAVTFAVASGGTDVVHWMCCGDL